MLKKKLNTLLNLARKGELTRLLVAVLNNLFPVGNKLLYWDRFYFLKWQGEKAYPPGCQARLLTANNIQCDQSVKLFSQFPTPLDTIKDRLANGSTCSYLTSENGSIIGYMWFDIKQSSIQSRSGYNFKINQPACWLYDLYIFPEYRRKGYATKLEFATMAAANEKGINDFFFEVHFLNKASINMHLEIGFTFHKSISFFSVLNKKYFRENDD